MTHRYLRKMESSPFINHLVDGTLPLIWAKTRLLSDDPAKGEGKAKRHSPLPQRLFDIMAHPVNASILSLPILYRHAQVWRNSYGW